MGDVAPLVGYRVLSFHFDSFKDSFSIKNLRVAPTLRISLIGVTWISRHYFELYNAQKAWEVQEIRKIVREKNNCDDLALNFLVGLFYH